MNKKLIAVLVLAFVVGITAAAFAEVQNVKIGGDITAVGVIRNELDLAGSNGNADAGNADGFASIARIKIDANLTDNVDVTFRLLNERGWGGTTGTAYDSDAQVDVDLAFVTLKEFMKETTGVPVTLVLGRQNIKIGSGLLIGAAGTNQSNTTTLPAGLGDLSARSAFDAIVGVWEWTPEFTMITGFVKASEAAIAQGRDNNVYVVDASYNLGEDFKNTVVEGTYVLQALRKDNVQNLGGRVVSAPIENLGVEAEYVYQTARTDGTGTDTYWDDNHKTKAADAMHLAVSLGLPDVVWKPTLAADFARLSNRWNVMHESWTPADLANLMFANTAVTCIGFTASAKPMDDLALKFRYVNLALTKKGLAAYTSAGTGAAYVLDPTKKDLGNEYDLGLAYDYTSDVQFGLNYGMFKPGKAFDASNRKTASQVLGSMKVSF